jgi:uncharacterized protein involved in outer membrane biogenesis
MKKIVIRILIVFVVLFGLGMLLVSMFLGTVIKKGVLTVGPMLTKVDIKLDSVNLSLLSGSGSVKGLVVGNPEGYKTPSAIKAGSASLALRPGSLFSDKIVIKSVNVQAPEITFETNLKDNNLSKILANVEAAAGMTGDKPATKPNEPAPAKEAKPSKKLQVDDFLITGGKIHVSITTLGGQSMTVPLPEIHLTALGQGPDGITGAELTKRVLQAIEKAAAQASSGAVADLGNQAAKLGKDLGKSGTDAAGKITEGIGGLFKKK